MPKTKSQYIDFLNTIQNDWVAGKNERFYEQDQTYFKKYLGVLDTKSKLVEKQDVIDENLPSTFDSREAWPNCESIKEIRDQGDCGSCWAFGAVESMSDRICIASKQTKQTRISANDLNSCCASCGNGCNGGYPSAAWQYWVEDGIVTGDLYNITNKWCQPYKIPSCDHHVVGSLKPCKKEIMPTPPCKHSCRSGYDIAYGQDKHFGAKAYGISNNVAAIQTEIKTNGPVEASMTVYGDFEHYKSGVYKHVSQQVLGGHAVKIIGWGEENGTPYWLVANSWNEDWGLKGLFKILRGTDESGIESGINAGLPK